jgi:hypothetical protein
MFFISKIGGWSDMALSPDEADSGEEKQKLVYSGLSPIANQQAIRGTFQAGGSHTTPAAIARP